MYEFSTINSTSMIHSGGTLIRFPVQELAVRFCKYKSSYVCGSWELKNIKGIWRINKNAELNASIWINTIYDISKDKLFRNDELLHNFRSKDI